jgi:hypothetical protein
MANIILNIPDKSAKVVMEALETESLRLKYGIELSQKRLSRFEKKYNVPSKKFIDEWSAEDLAGKDLEYVEWAGEYRLSMRLTERLNALKSIQRVSS